MDQGFDGRESLIGAWAAAGRAAHGRYSASGFAKMLGINRRTISRHLKRGEPLALAVAQLRADYWADRISDVDEVIYQKARAGDISAARLFYQRANVYRFRATGLPLLNAKGAATPDDPLTSPAELLAQATAGLEIVEQGIAERGLIENRMMPSPQYSGKEPPGHHRLSKERLVYQAERERFYGASPFLLLQGQFPCQHEPWRAEDK